MLSGYRIRKGTEVALSPYVTHCHPAFWEQPEAFDPERYTPKRISARPRWAYFPFGGGPRLCIGNGFAELEAQLTIAMIAQRYRIKLEPGQEVRAQAMTTLRPSGVVLVRLSRT